MNTNSLEVFLFSVPVAFSIALREIRFSRHCAVALRMRGTEGHGSGVLYKNYPLSAMRLLRREALPLVESADFAAVQEFRQNISQRFLSRAPSLVYAFDSALWDLEGKIEGKPVNELLGSPVRENVDIAEQVFIKEIDQTLKEIETIVSHGTRHIKVKIGRHPVDDVARVRRIRQMVSEEVELSVDINYGYTFHQAAAVGRQLRDLGVTVLEDPLRPEDWHRIPTLRDETGASMMLDAGVRSLHDLERAIALGAIDILNLKLTRIGGLTSALAFARVCQQNGVRLSIGCNEDLGMGMASILHLSSVLPDLYATEGVGPHRLGFDIVEEPWRLRDGTLRIPEGPGLGVTFSKERLTRAAQNKGFVIGDVRDPSTAFLIRETFNKWYQRSFSVRCKLNRKARQLGRAA